MVQRVVGDELDRPEIRAAMNRPYYYEICIEGHLPARWSDWFEDLTVCSDDAGGTKLSGVLIDQAALFGVLSGIHALNLTLVSVNRRPMSNGNIEC